MEFSPPDYHPNSLKYPSIPGTGSLVEAQVRSLGKAVWGLEIHV